MKAFLVNRPFKRDCRETALKYTSLFETNDSSPPLWWDDTFCVKGIIFEQDIQEISRRQLHTMNELKDKRWNVTRQESKRNNDANDGSKSYQSGAKNVEVELIVEVAHDPSVQRLWLNETNDRRLATPPLWLDKIDFDEATGAKITDRVQPIVWAIIRQLGNNTWWQLSQQRVKWATEKLPLMGKPRPGIRPNPPWIKDYWTSEKVNVSIPISYCSFIYIMSYAIDINKR